MGKLIFGMTMSLDGFVTDRNGSAALLYPDMEAMRASPELAEWQRVTGAVVMGRRSYEMAEGDFTGYEFQTPIFVLTHNPPEQPAKGENENLKFTFVTDGIASAIAQAKTAAGERDVTMVGGADTGQQALAAGLIDELHVVMAPILLGGGLRLFEYFDADPIKLETLGVTQSYGVIHLKFRVIK